MVELALQQQWLCSTPSTLDGSEAQCQNDRWCCVSSSNHVNCELSGNPWKWGVVNENPRCVHVSAFISKVATGPVPNQGADVFRSPLIAAGFSSGLLGSSSRLEQTRFPTRRQGCQSYSGWVCWLADVLKCSARGDHFFKSHFKYSNPNLKHAWFACFGCLCQHTALSL